MYKFVILDIERNNFFFLMFLRYRSNYHDFNNPVIISKIDACKLKKSYFFIYKTICKYNIFFRDLSI